MSNEIPPKYCHHKASGQAIVYINGRQIYLGKYRSAASREAYNRLIAEWSSSGILPKSGDALTCNELILAYVRYAKRYYTKNGSVSTEVELIRDACRVLKLIYGGYFNLLRLTNLFKFKCGRINAVTQTSRRWAISKDMAQMGTTTDTFNFNAIHRHATVSGGNQVTLGYWRPETGPAAARIVFGR